MNCPSVNCLRRAAAPALVLLALGSYAAVEAQAPTAIPGRIDPTILKGGVYTADPAHSLVGWRVNHLGFNDYFGIFGDVAGTLRLDPKAPGEAGVDVTIPVSSVTLANAALRDHLLRPGTGGGKPDFFGAAPAPAHFVSTGVVLGPDGVTADVAGRLTLNGITKPVKLYVRFTGAGPAPMTNAETVGFEGRASIKRSDFGLGFGVPLVSDEVELELTAAFEAAGTAVN